MKICFYSNSLIIHRKLLQFFSQKFFKWFFATISIQPHRLRVDNGTIKLSRPITKPPHWHAAQFNVASPAATQTANIPPLDRYSATTLHLRPLQFLLSNKKNFSKAHSEFSLLIWPFPRLLFPRSATLSPIPIIVAPQTMKLIFSKYFHLENSFPFNTN